MLATQGVLAQSPHYINKAIKGFWSFDQTLNSKKEQASKSRRRKQKSQGIAKERRKKREIRGEENA